MLIYVQVIFLAAFTFMTYVRWNHVLIEITFTVGEKKVCLYAPVGFLLEASKLCTHLMMRTLMLLRLGKVQCGDSRV